MFSPLVSRKLLIIGPLVAFQIRRHFKQLFLSQNKTPHSFDGTRPIKPKAAEQEPPVNDFLYFHQQQFSIRRQRSTMYSSFAASLLLAYVMLGTSARPIDYLDDVPTAPCASPSGKDCFSIKSYGPLSIQYHSQNENGKTVFGYAYQGQAAYNVRNAFGDQVGSWAYVNPEGKEVNVAYVSDSNGYRVMSNDLPIAPTETPEVVALRAKHMAAHASINSKTNSSLSVEDSDFSAEDVDPDFAEINAAQIEFMKVFREIQAL